MKILNTLRSKRTLEVGLIPKYNLYFRASIGLTYLEVEDKFMHLFEKTPNEAT